MHGLHTMPLLWILMSLAFYVHGLPKSYYNTKSGGLSFFYIDNKARASERTSVSPGKRTPLAMSIYNIKGLENALLNFEVDITYRGYVFVGRNDWGARPPTSVAPLSLPVPYVIIHHSYIPGACYTAEECKMSMRWMQDYHQLTNGYADIGYSFAVGGDGAAYEGRGWDAVGAHALGYNNDSIGIVLIGDWISTVPPAYQIQTVKKLIATGVKLGYISQDYMLIGHRQVRNTECPGDALFEEIATWDRFEPDV